MGVCACCCEHSERPQAGSGLALVGEKPASHREDVTVDGRHGNTGYGEPTVRWLLEGGGDEITVLEAVNGFVDRVRIFDQFRGCGSLTGLITWTAFSGFSPDSMNSEPTMNVLTVAVRTAAPSMVKMP